jgi:hypothetical protein
VRDGRQRSSSVVRPMSGSPMPLVATRPAPDR